MFWGLPYEKEIIDYETMRNLIGGMITYVSYVWF